MSCLIASLCQFSLSVLMRIVLMAVLGLLMVSRVSADDIAVSEQTFGCILDWPKVRNTRFKHEDPQKLKEAMHILRDSIPDKEYPVGTILQLVPFEAMVKHEREKFPKTTAGNSSRWIFPSQARRSGIGATTSSIFCKA